MLSIDTTTYRSPNRSARPATIQCIVLHTCEGTRQSSLPWLCKPAPANPNPVSSHYYVCRDGATYQLVPDGQQAWHAGVGLWGVWHNLNLVSLGIECEHKHPQDWPAPQLAALAELCRVLIARYPIAPENVIAHRWLAPDRKVDPTDFDDNTLRAFIVSLYASSTPAAPHASLSRYRVVGETINVRAQPDVASAVKSTRVRGEIVSGTEQDGAPVAGNRRWLKLTNDAGYIWRPLLEAL